MVPASFAGNQLGGMTKVKLSHCVKILVGWDHIGSRKSELLYLSASNDKEITWGFH